MRILYIGSVRLSYELLKHILSFDKAEVVGIITKRESLFNADFFSLEPLAKEYKIPYFIYDQTVKEEMPHFIKKCSPDVIYCFGWSHLLKSEVLEIPRLGVIGYHPAALPQNRGRHPIIWALALGLTETASTFFFMDEGADSGDILNQKTVYIEESDHAGSLYDKLVEVAKNQVAQFTTQLAKNTYTRVPQDHRVANYWRKRNKEDGKIDWRMSAKTINNLVRALTKPYVGAHCIHQGKEIKIWKTEITHHHIPNIEPGKILEVNNDGTVLIKCGEGVIKIVDHEFDLLPSRGEYL